MFVVCYGKPVYHVFILTDMKRKAEYQLVKKYKNPQISALQRELAVMPRVAAQIQSNKAAAVILRQARMSAMPLQRATLNESGFVDANISQNADTTGAISLLATIAQGASVNQRVGKKCMYQSIQVRGRAISSTTTTISTMALLIVYDKRPTGALPAVTDILVSANVNSLNNDTNGGRFQIVRRYQHAMIGNTITPSTGAECYKIDDFIKFRRPLVGKAAATGAIGDIEEGALYVVAVGQNVAGSTASDYIMQYRVRFTEN